MAGTISVGGLASGLDVNGIVDQLVAAERKPAEARLNLKEGMYTAELSAYGTLKSELSSFRSAISGLKSATTFSARSVSSSDSSIVAASASSIADSGSYSVSVEQLAQAHSLAGPAFDDASSTVGTGTLTFRFGTTDYDAGTSTYNGFTQKEDSSTFTLTVDETNNTLSGLRDAINAKGMGVRASIVNDGSGYRLLLTSEKSGAENSLEIVVGDSDYDAATNADGNTDDAGLSRLAFNSAGAQMEQTMAAQDAIATVNGLTITRDSNVITGALDGTTLTLKKASPGTPVDIEVRQDTAKASAAIAKFVEAYNGLNDVLGEMGRYDSEKGEAGLLQGQPILRAVKAELRRALGQGDAGTTGAFRSLADIGITTAARDQEGVSAGGLVLDQSELDAALASNFDDIAQLFAATGTPTDSEVEFISAGAAVAAGRYGVEITQAATQGSYTGAAITGYAGSIVIDGDNNALSFKIDGASPGSIYIPDGSYSGDELAAEIQSRLNGLKTVKDRGQSVQVEFDTDHFVIRSAAYGSDSNIEISGADSTSAVTLGLSVGAGTAGVDVAGRIGGIVAEGKGRILTGRGAVEGLTIEVSGTSTGGRGFIDYARGVGARLTAALDAMLADDNMIDSRMEGLEDRIDDIAEDRTKLNERIKLIEERYRSQFTMLELTLGQLNKTSEYLAQQLENLPSLNKKK